MQGGLSQLLLGLAAGVLSACSTFDSGPPVAMSAADPIIFVHGNGDNSSLFVTTAWRFASNGWREDRLFAFDLPHPNARDLDDVPQANRSSAEEYAAFLAQRIAEVKAITGAGKVILIGNSRGGYPIRRVIRDGGAASVSAAVLGGTPNHGTYISTSILPTSEYNGAGPWLTGLNAPQPPDGSEVTAGVRFLTLRSDHNDKYAQPTGAAYGHPELATHIDASAPALQGATNVVLPGADHRETIYSLPAFQAMFQFLTGQPATRDLVAEPRAQISGRIFSIVQTQSTNLPLADTRVVIYPVDAATGERTGAPLLDQFVGADGTYGPVSLDSSLRYEFVLSHAGYAVTHVYFARLWRSTAWLNLVLQPEEAKPSADAQISLVRIAGYFNTQRDRIEIDGVTPQAAVAPVPSVAVVGVTVPAAQGARAVVTRMNDETIVVRAYPGRDASGHTQRVVAELLD